MSSAEAVGEAFGAYARYYDLLNREKDYESEALYVHEFIRRYAPAATRLLELGCGTGGHAVHFARLGHVLHGVDLSAGMLDAARARAAALGPALARGLSFEQGDARTYRSTAAFDAVLSLFHVMSYQRTNEDLARAFETASAHLQPGGLFLFDFWYGPGVLSDPPAVRVRRLEDAHSQVLRIAEPTLLSSDNCVDVRYEIVVSDKASGLRQTVLETHRMRYLFLPEIRLLLTAAGFEMLEARAWMQHEEPSLSTWNAVVCARRVRAEPGTPAARLWH